MGRLSGWAQFNHLSSHKKKRETSERGEGNIITETETGVMGHEARNANRLQELVRKAWILPWSLQDEAALLTPWS